MRLICSICKCSEVDPAARPPFDGWIAGRCQHVFHSYCINKWCKAIKCRALFHEPVFTCPNCRTVWTNPPQVFPLRLDYFDESAEVSPSLKRDQAAIDEGQKDDVKDDCVKCEWRVKTVSDAKKQIKAARLSMLQVHQMLRGMERCQAAERVPIFEEQLRCGLKYVKKGRQSLLKLQQELGRMERLQLIEKPEAAPEHILEEESGQLKTCEEKPPQVSENRPQVKAAADIPEVVSATAAAQPEEAPVAKIVEFKGIRLGFKYLKNRQKPAESNSITNRDEDWD